MFSTKEFIEASRRFVCIRIETYENKQSEAMVRKLLNGRFANTAFCLFDPQGILPLSRAGRSPGQVMNRRSDESPSAVVAEMKRIAGQYMSRGNLEKQVLQDFLTFRQALNVASADQRLLVYVNATEAASRKISPTLQAVFADKEIKGRFHLDFAGKQDASWGKMVSQANAAAGINIIRAGKFGQDGIVMARIPLTAKPELVKTKLLAANKQYSETEDRKSYADHVMEGKRKGITYETEIPYGEDRDGDGEIDGRGGRSSSGRSTPGRRTGRRDRQP